MVIRNPVNCSFSFSFARHTERTFVWALLDTEKGLLFLSLLPPTQYPNRRTGFQEDVTKLWNCFHSFGVAESGDTQAIVVHMSVVLVTVKDGGRPGGGGTQLLGFEKKIKVRWRQKIGSLKPPLVFSEFKATWGPVFWSLKNSSSGFRGFEIYYLAKKLVCYPPHQGWS